jgi:hypothetical protein
MSDVIHLLKFGVTACLLPGMPRDWPSNHKWVGEEDKEKVTCGCCKKGMEFGDPTFKLLDNGTKIKCLRCGDYPAFVRYVEDYKAIKEQFFSAPPPAQI